MKMNHTITKEDIENMTKKEKQNVLTWLLNEYGIRASCDDDYLFMNVHASHHTTTNKSTLSSGTKTQGINTHSENGVFIRLVAYGGGQ